MITKKAIKRNRAIAIISTLGVLALVTVLLLGLLSSSSTELTSSNHYADNLEAKALSETATNMVIAQIRSATGRIDEAWASQPGAIRRWSQSGEFVAGHKLYSDSKMVESGSELELSSDLPDTDWQDLPARYTDLNEPAVRVNEDGSIRAHFPIVDPRAGFPEGGDTFGAPGSVEGFDIDSAGTSGIVLNNDHTARVPMPVEWLYILKDGTVGHLDESNKFVPAGLATEENPIVGRIAYWADDESAKVNINTASEPTFWDLPRSVSAEVNAAGDEPKSEDVFYAKYQPGQGEYQRYPGHPATTSLSTILFPDALTPDDKETIYELVPRVVGGGSKSGTFWDQRQAIFRIDPTIDKDRLFTAGDEFLFSPDRRTATLLEDGLLERSSFFLTAKSRASELNIFGLPKICMWPIDSRLRSDSAHDGNYWLSPADSLFEFVSTMGWDDTNSNRRIDSNEHRNAYIYQRVNANTVSDEWKEERNVQLWDYVAALTSRDAPGYGGNFEDKYNQSSSFIGASIEGNDRDNLITAMFDYIRITNGLDPYRQANGQRDFIDGRGQVHPLTKDIGGGGETRGFGRQYTISSVGLGFICNVDPIHWPDSNQPNHIGFTEIEGHENLPEIDHDDDPATANVKALPKDRIAIQAAMLIDTGVVMQGWRRSSEDWLHAKVAGLQNLRVWGYPDANPGTAPSWVPLFEYDAQLIDIRDGGGYHGRNWGGHIGLRPWMAPNGGPAGGHFRPAPPVDGNRSSRGRLRSNIVLIPVNPADPQASRIRFQGGDIEIDVFRGVGDGNFTFTRTGPSHVHTFFMNWPSHDSGFPRPYLAQASPNSDWTNGNGTYYSPQDWWHWDPRIDRIQSIPSYPWGDPPPVDATHRYEDVRSRACPHRCHRQAE